MTHTSNNTNSENSVTAIILCMTDSERPYIADAVESVMLQTKTCKIRIYVESSNKWISQNLDINDNIVIRYVPLAPPGVVRNLGVSESDTIWIAFLDGDNLWLSNKLDKQLNAAEETDVNIVTSDHYMIDESNTNIAVGLGGKKLPMTSSWLVKRELLLKVPFSDKMKGEDAEWWSSAVQFSNAYRVNSPLIKYRLKNISLSSNTPSKKRKMILLGLSKYYGLRHIILASTFLASKIYKWL